MIAWVILGPEGYKGVGDSRASLNEAALYPSRDEAQAGCEPPEEHPVRVDVRLCPTDLPKDLIKRAVRSMKS